MGNTPVMKRFAIDPVCLPFLRTLKKLLKKLSVDVMSLYR